MADVSSAPAARRQGYADALLQRWSADCAANGVTRLLLEVRESNAAAQALYRKHGFADMARRRGYYSLSDGAREDALIMEKIC